MNSKHWNKVKASEQKSRRVESCTTTRINWWEAYLKRSAEHRYTTYKDYVMIMREALK